MKKIITAAVREEAELICDLTSNPAVARLVMVFGYGSFRDGDLLKAGERCIWQREGVNA